MKREFEVPGWLLPLGTLALLGFAVFFTYHTQWRDAAVNLVGGIFLLGYSIWRVTRRRPGDEGAENAGESSTAAQIDRGPPFLSGK